MPLGASEGPGTMRRGEGGKTGLRPRATRHERKQSLRGARCSGRTQEISKAAISPGIRAMPAAENRRRGRPGKRARFARLVEQKNVQAQGVVRVRTAPAVVRQ